MPYGALEALINDGGSVTFGAVNPFPDVAIAAMPAGMTAALVRRPEETIPQILQRLNDTVVQGFLENRIISELEI